jgi:hypothetical protein
MDPEAYVGDGGTLPVELTRRCGIVVSYAAAYNQASDNVSQWRDGRVEHYRNVRQRARQVAIRTFRDRLAGVDQYSDVEDDGVATPPAVASLSDGDFMDVVAREVKRRRLSGPDVMSHAYGVELESSDEE